MRSHEQIPCETVRVTDETAHHYFGYYDKTPWDESGRLMLGMEARFMDRNPSGCEPLTLGVIDTDQGNAWRPLAQSRAWNWQQGCMLRWLPSRPGKAVFNDRHADRYVSRILDVQSGTCEPFLDRALYDVCETNPLAATLSFERITDCRPGYGYFGLNDPNADKLQPEDDGLYLVDLSSGEVRMLVSIRGAAVAGDVQPGPADRAWFNPIKFNPSGTRILFFHRWAAGACPGHVGFQTRVMTIGLEGQDLRCLSEGCRASHFDWLDDEHLLIFLYHPDGDGYYLINERTGEKTRVGEDAFGLDGHCLYRPQKDWFLTDTYPQGERGEQVLMLYECGTGRCIDIGRFAAMDVPDPSMRCDLHSRWDRAGRRICFDSTHEGSRQMYCVNVAEIVDDG